MNEQRGKAAELETRTTRYREERDGARAGELKAIEDANDVKENLREQMDTNDRAKVGAIASVFCEDKGAAA